MKAKMLEILEELRLVLAGRSLFVDTILPPIVFVLINGLFGFSYAMWSALGLALVIAVLRLLRGQSALFALGGVGGTLLAILISRLLGRAEGFFLPGIFTNGLTVILCLLSLLVKRPLVAWTSYMTRRWPLGWYWHPQVRPAYSEVTLAWTLFFALRLLLQLNFFQNQQEGLLALVNLLAGWPAILVLLIASYLYGVWRLQRLKGPNIEEYKAHKAPPWEGQRRGF
jgi:predicted membrane protein